MPPHHEDDGDSTMAEYCCPVWARSTHRKLVDTTLNETCRLITGCIRPTATPDLYVLSGIAPPEIRRSVHSQNERTKQLTDQRHSLHHHQPAKSRLHSRNSFVSTSQPLLCKPAEARIAKWQESKEVQHRPKRTTPEWSHAAVACMADIQPSALGTGCHPGSETSVGLPGQQKLYVRRSHMRPEPHHDELHTFRRETEPRRYCRNEGWIRAVAESHCRHDMMMMIEKVRG